MHHPFECGMGARSVGLREKRLVEAMLLCMQHQLMSNVVDHWSHGIRGGRTRRQLWTVQFGVRAHLYQKILTGLFVVEVRWPEKDWSRNVCGGNECDCMDALAATTVDRGDKATQQSNALRDTTAAPCKWGWPLLCTRSQTTRTRPPSSTTLAMSSRCSGTLQWGELVRGPSNFAGIKLVSAPSRAWKFAERVKTHAAVLWCSSLRLHR